MASHRRCQSRLVFLASAVAVSLLFTDTITNNRKLPPYPRNEDGDSRPDAPPRIGSDPRAPQPAVHAANANERFSPLPIDHESRSRCQIVYVMGVEGATHHGFVPVLERLARSQADPESGRPYAVDSDSFALKAGLFGWFHGQYTKRWGFQETPEVDDPDFVRRVVEEACPDDGRKHVLIESTSFPSGQEDDPRPYRVRRQRGWRGMAPEELAGSDEARAHPASMDAFYRGYSPLADVKFAVLHRPYLETVASHPDWDGGPEAHSNVLRGFMLILRRFLDGHPRDLVGGGRLWSLVCVERITTKNYKSAEDAASARANVLSHLADFLGWPNGECARCFDGWHDSSKDPVKVLGEKNVGILRGHMGWLEGVWPPPGEEGVDEQRCGI